MLLNPRPSPIRAALLWLVAVAGFAWMAFPMLCSTYTEGFEPSIALGARGILRNDFGSLDLLYPFNGQFFLLTRLGASVVLAGLLAVDSLSVLASFRLLMIGSWILLVASLFSILIRQYRTSVPAVLIACLLFPALFESAYFFNDNVLGAGLSSAALAVYWNGRDTRAAVLGGVLLGLSVAVRPDSMFIVPAFGFVMLFKVRSWRVAAMHVAIAGAICAMLPVAIYAACGLSYRELFVVIPRGIALWARHESWIVLVPNQIILGFALPGLVAMLLGIASFYRRRAWFEVCLCVAVPVLYFGAYGNSLFEIRYLLPLSPFFLIAMLEGFRSVGRTRGTARSAVVGTLVVATLACVMLPYTPHYWRIPRFGYDGDGPRPLVGRFWAPILWMAWLDNLNAGVSTMDALLDRAADAGGTTVVVSGGWSPSRLADLMLLNKEFEGTATQTPASCIGVAETFHRGSSTVLHVRSEIPFVVGENAKVTWRILGEPCVRDLAGDQAKVVVFGWSGDRALEHPSDQAEWVYRPSPETGTFFRNFARPTYFVARLPLDAVASVLAAPATPEIERRAVEVARTRPAMLQ